MYAKTALLLLFTSLAYAAVTKKNDEKTRQLGVIFDSLDTNNDGKISLEEAKRFYKKVGLNEASIEEQFQKADTNGDNVVTKEEFEKYAKDIKVPTHEDFLDGTFDAIDKDDNHYITLAEAKQFYTSLGIPAEAVADDFKKADKNGDGHLTKEEFKAYAKANEHKK